MENNCTVLIIGIIELQLVVICQIGILLKHHCTCIGAVVNKVSALTAVAGFTEVVVAVINYKQMRLNFTTVVCG